MRPARVLIALAAWLLIALLVGASGLFASARPPLPQVILFGLLLALLLLFWRSSAFRRWALDVDVRWLVAIHLFRFVGFYFLALYARGELPYAFAVPGGWGDIIVATAALVLLIFLSFNIKWSWSALLLWNVCGFLDIAGVVATAARLGMENPESMRALIRLPLSLLPTFLVPIIFFTHIVIFVRLLNRRGENVAKL